MTHYTMMNLPCRPLLQRVGQVGRVDSQCMKDRSANQGVEQPARQRHGLGVLEHPAVRRQEHEVGGIGPPGASQLPDEALDLK